MQPMHVTINKISYTRMAENDPVTTTYFEQINNNNDSYDDRVVQSSRRIH